MSRLEKVVFTLFIVSRVLTGSVLLLTAQALTTGPGEDCTVAHRSRAPFGAGELLSLVHKASSTMANTLDLLYLIKGAPRLSYFSVPYNSDGRFLTIDNLRMINFTCDCKESAATYDDLTILKVSILLVISTVGTDCLLDRCET